MTAKVPRQGRIGCVDAGLRFGAFFDTNNQIATGHNSGGPHLDPVPGTELILSNVNFVLVVSPT